MATSLSSITAAFYHVRKNHKIQCISEVEAQYDVFPDASQMITAGEETAPHLYLHCRLTMYEL